MHTTKNPDNTWTCHIRLRGGVAAVCEATRRSDARKGALAMVRARVARKAGK